MSRFSKSKLMDELETRIQAYASNYGFDLNNGTAQLKGKLAAVDTIVAYGKMKALQGLLQEIEDGRI